jgi:ubiquinone/menaquinone biosynthesis C-methylase UbiE
MACWSAIIAIIAAILATGLLWRWASARRSLPCPAWLGWMVDNPLAKRRTDRTLALLELAPGHRVLDAGCGPGRLTIAMARAVGPQGRVLGVDLQPEMLRRVEAKARAAALDNVEVLEAGLGDGKLPRQAFDRAVLVTVLGEIPDRRAALREIFEALVPGGFLLVEEVLGDPHYQSMATVSRLAADLGFRPASISSRWLSYSTKLERPSSPEEA